jgi:uncharacterized membrane protein YgcG
MWITKKLLSVLTAAAFIFSGSINAFAAGSNAVTVDTGPKLSILSGNTYQFKVTSRTKPTFVCGASSVFQVSSAVVKGNDYFFKATAVGKPGDSAGFYVNGEKAPRTVATIVSSSVKCDTGKQLSVPVGKSYQFKITSPYPPTFTCGLNTVFSVTANGSTGNDYFFKVTAVGKVGDFAAFYVNGAKDPVTIGTIVTDSSSNSGDTTGSGTSSTPTQNTGSGSGSSSGSGNHSHSGGSSGGSSGNGSGSSQSVTSLTSLQTALSSSTVKTISVNQPITLDSTLTIPTGKTVILNQKMTVDSTLTLAGTLQTPTSNVPKSFARAFSMNAEEPDSGSVSSSDDTSDAKLEIGDSGTVQAESGSSLSFASLDDIITPSETSLCLYSGANVQVAGKQYIGSSSNNAYLQLSDFADSDSYAGGFFLSGDNELLLCIFQQAQVLKSDKNSLDLHLLVKGGENASNPGKLTIPDFDIMSSNGSIVVEANATLISDGKSIVSASDAESTFNATGGDTDNRRGVYFLQGDNDSLVVNLTGDVSMNRAFKVNGTAPEILPQSFDADDSHSSAVAATLKINFAPEDGDFSSAHDNWYSEPAQGQTYREQDDDSDCCWVSTSDATLTSIRINGHVLDNFDPSVKDYTVTVDSSMTDFPDDIATARMNSNATVDVSYSETFPGTMTILVTAEDGVTQDTYTVTFVKN